MRGRPVRVFFSKRLTPLFRGIAKTVEEKEGRSEEAAAESEGE